MRFQTICKIIHLLHVIQRRLQTDSLQGQEGVVRHYWFYTLVATMLLLSRQDREEELRIYKQEAVKSKAVTI